MQRREALGESEGSLLDDPDHLGLRGDPDADELDGGHLANKRWPRLLGDWITQPLLESGEENHGAPDEHY